MFGVRNGDRVLEQFLVQKIIKHGISFFFVNFLNTMIIFFEFCFWWPTTKNSSNLASSKEGVEIMVELVLFFFREGVWKQKKKWKLVKFVVIELIIVGDFSISFPTSKQENNHYNENSNILSFINQVNKCETFLFLMLKGMDLHAWCDQHIIWNRFYSWKSDDSFICENLLLCFCSIFSIFWACV